MTSIAHGKAHKTQANAGKNGRRRRIWLLFGALVLMGLIVIGIWQVSASASAPREAPEAQKVLDVQANIPFQILIPAYLPTVFDRAGMDIKVDTLGPSGEPMAQLAYHTRQGATVFMREWVPVNPDMEILSGSRPIETKWGKGWLLTQGGNSLVALWVDVGPLRISIFSPNLNAISREQIVQVAETLGPPSNNQIFAFDIDPPKIKDMPPPPPVEIATNAEGIQEVTLVITPGGYSPLRFAVKKGVPVRLIFRKLGEVGCGDTLIFPADPTSPTALSLDATHDKQVLEFTPQQTGEFQFHCAHMMYRGLFFVHD